MKKIAIDMDEVLADTIAKFKKIFHERHQTPLDLPIQDGHEIGASLPGNLAPKIQEYINEPGFFRDIDVIPDSQEVVIALQQHYEVYIVSAAMEFRNSLVDKFDWLSEYFPSIPWTHIMFCGNKIVDADVLIDDRTKNLISFKGRSLLFSSPHNLLETKFERVNDWKEVADLLLPDAKV